MQLHLYKVEVYHVLSGSGQLELGEKEIIHELAADDSVYLPAGVLHRLVASDEGIVIEEVATPETTDIIRVGKAHGRQTNPKFDYPKYMKVMAPGKTCGTQALMEENTIHLTC